MAASAVGWVVVTSLLLGSPLDGPIMLLAFVLAVAFYTRDRLDEQEKQVDITTMPERTQWVHTHQKELGRLIWLCVGLALLVLALRPRALPPILIGLGFALTYTVRWLPWRGKRISWKQVPGMKMPYVAILWTLLTVLTPANLFGQLWHITTWQIAATICLLIMLQILVNDLRDIEGDRRSETLSLPVWLGEQKARRVGYLLALLAAFIGVSLASIALPLTALYSAILIWLYRRHNDPFWRPWIESQGVIASLLMMLRYLAH